MSALSEPRPRRIRVFISSTFRDMQAERDELVKRVFPALRRLCESRDVTWGEVDLRWGVTDEAKAEGRVLPICLEEIRRCRPFFIGLLGERYGWVPDEIDPALAAREPWLREHRDHSVTELEILHGVLNDAAMAPFAFFYFRDAAYVDRLPVAAQAAFREGPAADEIARLGVTEAAQRAARRAERLATLKQRIRSSGLRLRENYPDPRALGDLVLEDLTLAIDALFPADETLDPLRAASEEYRLFAAARSESAVVRPDLIDALDRHVAGNGPPLIVVGDTGAGKSTLLAMWTSRFRSAQPDRTIFEYYAGAAADSREWEALARRLAAELLWTKADQERVGDETFDVRNVLPRTPDALRDFLAASIHSHATPAMVLVIDGVDTLGDNSGRLNWLPATFAPALRVIVSAAPGAGLAELRLRGWPQLLLQPLARDERMSFIVDVLGRHGKALDTTRVQKIAAAPATGQPLFLGTVLNELRIHGEHETLDMTIEEYVSCPDAQQLYGRVLARCQRDYERERPGLVGEALSFIWASRRGLAETELLDLLGKSEAPLPHAQWAPLHDALRGALADHRGRVAFFHDDLRRAVAEYFLPDEAEQRRVRIRIAEYFERRGWQTRSIFETPWQLARAHEWHRLYEVLADPKFLAAAWVEIEPAPIGEAGLLAMLLPPPPASEITHFDVLRYWADVQANSSLKLLDAYRPIMAAPGDHRDALLPLSRLLVMTEHPAEALVLQRWLVEWGSDASIRARALIDEAALLGRAGHLDQMLPKIDKAEALFREVGDRDGILACVGNRAIALQTRGELDEALQCHREAESIALRLANRDAVATSLSNQAWIASARGRADEAVDLYERALKISQDTGNRRLTAMTLGNLGAILLERRRPDASMGRYQEQADIAREIGDGLQLAAALDGQASVLAAVGRVPEAIVRREEQAGVCEQLGRADLLFTSHRRRAELLAAAGRPTDALSAARAARWIVAKFGQTAECNEIDRLIEQIKETATPPR